MATTHSVVCFTSKLNPSHILRFSVLNGYRIRSTSCCQLLLFSFPRTTKATRLSCLRSVQCRRTTRSRPIPIMWWLRESPYHTPLTQTSILTHVDIRHRWSPNTAHKTARRCIGHLTRPSANTHHLRFPHRNNKRWDLTTRT